MGWQRRVASVVAVAALAVVVYGTGARPHAPVGASQAAWGRQSPAVGVDPAALTTQPAVLRADSGLQRGRGVDLLRILVTVLAGGSGRRRARLSHRNGPSVPAGPAPGSVLERAPPLPSATAD